MPFKLITNIDGESFVIVNSRNVVILKSLNYVDFDSKGTKVFRVFDFKNARADAEELVRLSNKGVLHEDDLPKYPDINNRDR